MLHSKQKKGKTKILRYSQALQKEKW